MTNKEKLDYERYLQGEGVMTKDGPKFGPTYVAIENKSLYER